MSYTVLEAQHISKTFHDHIDFPALKDISFKVDRGEFLAVMGKSGCGKSTLLYVLSTMDTSYEGSLLIDGELMTGKPGSRLAEVRNEKIGFVFQFHYLLKEFNVLKNVMLPGLKLNRYSESQIEDNAIKWLKVLSIDHLIEKKPNQLSGGEKQRVAIARALINDPLIIMGDEPTGNLDKKNSQVVLDTFKELSTMFQQTLLIVTHDQEFATHTNRTIEMEDGRIIHQ
jgi:lipoprotein-releasing system ATP-binding protein